MSALTERRKIFIWRACAAFVREHHPQTFEAIRVRAVELYPYVQLRKGRKADTYDSLMTKVAVKGKR